MTCLFSWIRLTALSWTYFCVISLIQCGIEWCHISHIMLIVWCHISHIMLIVWCHISHIMLIVWCHITHIIRIVWCHITHIMLIMWCHINHRYVDCVMSYYEYIGACHCVSYHWEYVLLGGVIWNLFYLK